MREDRVFRSYKDGRARIAGYLEDYASLALAALAVYELTFDEDWLDARARPRATRSSAGSGRRRRGRTPFDTASDQERLIARPREVTDNATPSGTSLAAELFLRLAELTGDDDLRRRATRIVESLAPAIERYPMAFGQLLQCADMLVNGAVEVALVGGRASKEFNALERTIATRFVPSLVLVAGDESSTLPLLRGRTSPEPAPAAAFVCRNYACEAPVTTAEQLEKALAT